MNKKQTESLMCPKMTLAAAASDASWKVRRGSHRRPGLGWAGLPWLAVLAGCLGWLSWLAGWLAGWLAWLAGLVCLA